MLSALSGSTFTPALLGFDDKKSENEFQESWTESLGGLDQIANISFSLLMAFVTARLAMDGAAYADLAGVFLGAAIVHGLWAWVLFWPKGSQKVRWRASIIIAQRLHNIYCGTVCDRLILYPYMKESSLTYMFHNLMTASRALVFPIIILGMRLPFRYHLPTQLVVTLAFTKLNQQLCDECSSAMQENFGWMAKMMSRIAASSMLLTPQTRLPSVVESRACFAVNELVMITFATLLPSVILCYWETKSRLHFQLERQERGEAALVLERASSSESAANEELSHAASVSMFPVAIAIVALPAMSFLWNLHVVADKLIQP